MNARYTNHGVVSLSYSVPSRLRIESKESGATSHVTADMLRHREQATAAMDKAIEWKIDRLAAARTERLTALSRIRSELALVSGTTPAAPDRHDLGG